MHPIAMVPGWDATLFLAFGLPGHWEVLIILLVILLLFGAKLPSMARNLGRSFVEFKKGFKDSGVADDPSLPKGESRARLESGSEAKERGREQAETPESRRS